MANLGYIRVSTVEQNTDRQLSEILPTLDKVYVDKISGGSINREQLTLLIQEAQVGDTIHVHSIDRFARNLIDLLGMLNQLNSNGINVHFHKEMLTFTGSDNPFQKLQLQMIGAFAEFERSMIRERQREGIVKAKERGVYKGRAPSLPHAKIRTLHHQGTPAKEIASTLNISISSVYRVVKGEHEC